MKYLTYNPEQGYLLRPSVRDVLGEDHVCFFLQGPSRLSLMFCFRPNVSRKWKSLRTGYDRRNAGARA
jgi:hypothetical protein